jgi:hypothetical protein
MEGDTTLEVWGDIKKDDPVNVTGVKGSWVFVGVRMDGKRVAYIKVAAAPDSNRRGVRMVAPEKVTAASAKKISTKAITTKKVAKRKRVA